MKSLSIVPLLLAILANPFECAQEKNVIDQNDSQYWNQLSSEALHASLLNKYNHAAKNVILFLGDGLGIRLLI